MKTEFMDQESIIAHLKSNGLAPIAKKEISKLMISKKVIHCESGDTLIAGMGSDKGKDDQIHLVVDAVHLCLQAAKEKKSLKLIFGKRKNQDEQAELENAVALMIESITKSKKVPSQIEIEVDCKKIALKPKSFNDVRTGKIEHWMQCMSGGRNIPTLAIELEKAIHNESFKWYRPVTGKYWSGRVAGLEVCKLDLAGLNGELNVGRPGKYEDGLARHEFLDICTRENFTPGPFSSPPIEKVASVICKIIESRKKGKLSKVQREHLLESQVLSETLEIATKEGILKSVCKDHPFQFPTLWGPSAAPRFVDALMRLGHIPYVVELKEPLGSSPGQGYRHAVTQAVLYREFIRRAEKVHPWFIKNELDPSKCLAVVAFPALPKNERHQMLLGQHKLVGEAFGVEIIEISGFE